MPKTNWNKRFLDLATHIGTWSKDKSTKIGCVIVGPDKEIRSTGYNGFPRDIEDDLDYRHKRPIKYNYTEHAERNAIYNAARIGVSIKDCTMYLSWFPCVACARAILQSGISQLICIEPNWKHERWGEEFKFSEELFMEKKLKLIFYPDSVASL